MIYRSFKRAVFERAGWVCEVVGCDATPDGVHHLLKQSTYPEFKLEVKNGLACCGPCHEEIERREREGVSTDEMVPEERRNEAQYLVDGNL